jgi:serine acetyltransferase
MSLSEVPASTNFVHPIGIVIRNGVSFGENCIIYQNVTIGNRRTGSENPARIGNNVTIGAGAIILGDVSVGDNTAIAAGSIVLTDVPKNSVYICEIKGRIVNVV